MVTAPRGRGPRKKRVEAGRARRKTAGPLAVDGEARQHLVEACAFFRADHFRPAEPGSYRAQDLKDAAAEIDAVIRRGTGKGAKR